MRKRLTFIIISITLVALMLCGWTAYAATSPNTTISTSVKGTFKSVSSDSVTVTTDKGDQTVPLAKSVWVYRDDQKALLTDLHAGDRIELIVNSKQQAAYVKATSADTSVTVTTQPAPATPSPTPTPALPAAETATKVPVSTTQPSSQENKEVYPDLEDIDLKVDGKHFKLHIGQIKSENDIIYDLTIKPEDAGVIHLKGDQAAVWIQKLLAAIDLKSSDAEQEIAQQIAEHYGLEASKLNVQMKTKWEQNQKVEHEDNDDHEDEDQDEDDSKNKNKDHQSKSSGKSDDHKKNEKQHANNNNNKNNHNDN